MKKASLLIIFLVMQCGLVEPEYRYASIIIKIEKEQLQPITKKTAETLDKMRCMVAKQSRIAYDITIGPQNNRFYCEIEGLESGKGYAVVLYGIKNEEIIALGYDDAITLDKGERQEVLIFWEPFFHDVYVEGGTFQMGSTSAEASDDEQPVHTVTLDNFYMSKYEITNVQYCAFLNALRYYSGNIYDWEMYIDLDDLDCPIYYNGSQFTLRNGMYDLPVIEVPWIGAHAFCEWADGRLPTEAEWEYAARGGAQSQYYLYSGSNTIDEVAWYRNNSDNITHPVGLKKPNELGLYDMSGNVWEWCNDYYDEDYYSESPTHNPLGPSYGLYCVLRGGAWNNTPTSTRCATRCYHFPDVGRADIGFRYVHDQ